MSDRCKQKLEYPLPDTPNHIRESVVIQCERPDGHRGPHKHNGEIAWSTV